jgi:hypothetical protein
VFSLAPSSLRRCRAAAALLRFIGKTFELPRPVIHEAPIFSRQKINDAVQSVNLLSPKMFSCDRQLIGKCHLSVALIAREAIFAIVACALRHLIGSHSSSVNLKEPACNWNSPETLQLNR